MKRLLLAAVAAVGILGMTGQAEAQNVSRNNPYRAFNHTGVNYGAQQLERQRMRSGYAGTGYGQTYAGGSAYRGVTAPLAGVADVGTGRWGYRSAYSQGGSSMNYGGAYGGGYGAGYGGGYSGGYGGGHGCW